jgi:hypothetical protein
MAQKIITNLLNKGCCHSFKVNSGFCKACMFISVQIFKLLKNVILWIHMKTLFVDRFNKSVIIFCHPFVFISVIKEIFLKWLVLNKVISCTGQRVILAIFYVFIQIFKLLKNVILWIHMKTLFVDRFNKSVIIFCAILKKKKSVFFRYFVPKTGMSNPSKRFF